MKFIPVSSQRLGNDLESSQMQMIQHILGMTIAEALFNREKCTDHL
jgi:hypothetical protein